MYELLSEGGGGWLWHSQGLRREAAMTISFFVIAVLIVQDFFCEWSEYKYNKHKYK